MEEVFKQSPIEMTYTEVEIIFLKNNKNVLETLEELWMLDNKSIKNIGIDDSKWNDIRGICDSFDYEMQNTLKKKKI